MNYNSFAVGILNRMYLMTSVFLFGAVFARVKIPMYTQVDSIESNQRRDPIIIMIDPYGDVRSSGRVIGNKFESELTYACAQKLKQDLEQEYDHVTVVISRTVGEQSYELARAQYANRLQVHGFLSIQFFHETNPIARWFMYRYCQQALPEFQAQKHSILSVDQAYLLNKNITDAWAQRVDKLLERNELKRFEPQGLISVPCTPLKGVLPPALLCEVGLKSPDDWTVACAQMKEIIKALIDLCAE